MSAGVLSHARAPFLAALLAMALLSAMDALIKGATGALGTWQIVALRYGFGLLATLPFAWPMLRRGVPRGSWAPNLVRGLLTVATAAQFFFALGRLPLAEAATLAFTAPLWLLVLGRVVLGERVAPRATWAVGLGFLGVLVVAASGAGGVGAGPRDPLGTAAALGAAVTYASALILTRARAAHDPAPLMVFVQGTAALAVATPLGLAAWRPMTAELWTLFVAVGLLGTSGHLALVWSLARAGVAEVAPAEYTTLLWAFVFGAAFFGECPRPEQAAGAALIVAACAVAGRARSTPA